MQSYLHPRIHSSESEAYKDVMRSTEPAICMEGPARTGKSIIGLRKLFAAHAKYKGLRTCAVRTNSVDLTDTLRYDIRETVLRYQLDDPRSQIRQQGGLTRFDHLYLNDGEMRLGGMNRPGAILGGEYDIVFLNELSQFSEEQFQLLKTRCSGSSAKWVLPDGTICNQMLCDTNPDIEAHWMYEYEKQGLIRFIPFTFTDNSYFYRDGRWAKVGKTVVEELDRGLVGFWHDRYFKGLRIAPHGIVYRLTKENILTGFPDLTGCSIYRAMDWGMTHPSVCLWIAENTETHDVFVFREWRKTHTDILEMGDAVNAFSEGEDIETTIIDHDENRQILLRDKCDIDSQFAYKGAGSVMDRVFLIQSALRRAQEGKPGGLYIYKDLLCNEDPNPDKNLKRDTINEMNGLQFSETKDAPDKKGDDGCDALGYFYLWRSKHVDVPFFGSVITKQSPEWFMGNTGI